MKSKDTFMRLREMEIGEAQAMVQETMAWVMKLSPEEAVSFFREFTEFRERIGAPLDYKKIPDDPVETTKASALGYYARAMMEVYKLEKLLELE